MLIEALRKRYTVVVGNFGSGKTELAIAIAKAKRKACSGRVMLVDMDIVNPYFRSASQEAQLEAMGIEVMKPTFALTNVDVPILPAQMHSVFGLEDVEVVIDVGGDEIGATALGRFRPHILPIRDEMQMLYVLNPCRPFSSQVNDVQMLYQGIVQRSRMTPDYLVNNTNLQEFTTAEEILHYREYVDEVSKELGLPIGFVAGAMEIKDRLPKEMQEYYFDFIPVMKPKWLVDAHE